MSIKKTTLLVIFSLAAISFSACTHCVPAGLTNNSIGTKEGKITVLYVFGIPVTNGGRATQKDAAKAAKIDKIATVDMCFTNYFMWVIGKKEIIVTGE